MNSNSLSPHSYVLSPSQSRTNKDLSPFSMQRNLEESRKLLYSVLVLKARDQIEALKSSIDPAEDSKLNTSVSKSNNASDDFWGQLDKLLIKHQEQMEKISNKALDIRTNLSNAQLSFSAAHEKRMRSLIEEEKKIDDEIKICEETINKDKAKELKMQQQELDKQVKDLQSQIDETKTEIDNLRKTNTELKTQMELSNAKKESKKKTIQKKKEELTCEQDVLDEEIRRFNDLIEEADEELAELGKRETVLTNVFSSIQQPFGSIQRIFTN